MKSCKLILMRAPSGYGKTTRAKELADEYERTGNSVRVVSADNFFMHERDGELRYEFDPSKLAEAHAECRAETLKAMLRNGHWLERHNVVIVDNTHCNAWEWQEYRHIAAIAQWELEIHEADLVGFNDISWCLDGNQHGVPVGVILQQAYALHTQPAVQVQGIKVIKWRRPGARLMDCEG